ncbi:MAG: ATP-binding protein, partial [Phycisphaerae bacterium]|nr:ATP-binding protein [Saprospiraceae bacterium]
MSNEPADKNLGEIFGEFSKTKDTIAQVLAALSRGIADLIKRPFKGLKNRLISLIAILLLLFNPLWGEGIIGFILKQFFGKEPSQIEWLQKFTAWWPYLFAGAVLLALIIMVWEQLTRKPLPPTQFRNPAIKGLLSFEQSDAEIFKKLQREADVQQVMSALTHQNFRFGVLTGVSGCGKTSLLKAGLLPALTEKNNRVVVVTLTDESPLESVQKALTAQLDVRFESNATNLQTILDTALQATGSKGFILIFDQFEQFFTQNKTEESRAPFIKDLFTAYQNTGQVKILLSIRLDFMGRLHEIQQLLQYSLNADQNYFNLRKFKPQQAVRIFFVMSEEGKLEAFDDSFMLKMTTAELASKEDGLVSAADVQWVATALQQAEGFA